jgi:response regulator of citrate/malate metabolism
MVGNLNRYIKFKSEIEKKIMIYIVSSSNNPDDVIQAKSIFEVTDYLIKPINRDKYFILFQNSITIFNVKI